MDSEDYGGCKSDNVNYHCYNLGDKDYGGWVFVGIISLFIVLQILYIFFYLKEAYFTDNWQILI